MITLPTRLKALLDKNDSFAAAVSGALATISPLVALSSLPFFPEYTDHGIGHLQTVLQTADALIPDDCGSALTPSDAATLVLAILLHDLGMHLTEAGFLALIDPSGPYSKQPMIPELDSLVWPQLWEDFLGEAKRFDGRSLKRLFGDTEPIRRPPSDPEQLTRRDRKLIGEFIRRHHARLAHEIARSGFPTSTKPLEIVSYHLPNELADLTGLVARSHGLPVRSCLPFLEKHFHLCEFQGVHAVYLMVILRIGDYLQVQSERAPSERLQVVDIKSPTSQGEWRAHQAIRNITFEGPDPWALDIKAVPGDVQTFLRLQDLLAGLQKELDLSWAVMGEVYGRHERLRRLALELRRVRSNLDDVNSFASLVHYIPQRARFESVDADLLNLLVEPLYGKNVNMGVRELLQNALDACRELKDFCEHTKRELPPATPGAPDVTVLLTGDEESGYQLTIADRGIGMTADVIRNYFLKAGASYRTSDAWRRTFESEPGRARVLRSGRFGIGVLAAFLLGEEIDVATRHITSGEQAGIRFRATLDADAIELEHCHTTVGTVVKITLRPDAAKSLIELGNSAGGTVQFGKLPYGLYLLDWPSLAVLLSDKSHAKPVRWTLPGAELPPEWHRIHVNDYQDVQWSYGPHALDVSSALACNGIAIGSVSHVSPWKTDAGIDLSTPAVSVFDANGKFPLVLTRTAMATPSFPFQAELIADICRDIVAFCLTDEAPLTWQRHVMALRPTTIPICRHPGLTTYRWDLSSVPYVMMSDGFALRTDWILQYLQISSLVVVSEAQMQYPFPERHWAITRTTQRGAMGLVGCDHFVRSHLSPTLGNVSPLSTVEILGAQVHVPAAVTQRWPNGAIGKGLLKRTEVHSGQPGIQTLTTRNFRPFDFTFKPSDGKIWVVAKCSLGAKSPSDPGPSAIGQTFVDVLGTCLIPYDPAERRERFPKAFENLKDYIVRREESAKKKSHHSSTE